MLFQADMGKQTVDQVRHTFWAEHEGTSDEIRGFAEDLFRVATDRVAEIDKLIEGHAEHWRMERMAAVDRNLLRAGVAEFLGYPETPRAVVINEALEIARKFPVWSRCSSSTACSTAWPRIWERWRRGRRSPRAVNELQNCRALPALDWTAGGGCPYTSYPVPSLRNSYGFTVTISSAQLKDE